MLQNHWGGSFLYSCKKSTKQPVWPGLWPVSTLAKMPAELSVQTVTTGTTLLQEGLSSQPTFISLWDPMAESYSRARIVLWSLGLAEAASSHQTRFCLTLSSTVGWSIRK